MKHFPVRRAANLRPLPALMCCLATALLASCKKTPEPETTESKTVPGAEGQAEEKTDVPIPAVEALPARHGRLPLEDRVSGIVRARNQVAVRPEVSGPIVEVFVRNGDPVKRGQPLVRLQPAPVQHQLDQARATVTLAEAAKASAQARLQELEAQVTRTRQLAEQKVVSELEIETQEAQLMAAKAAVAQADARVAESRAAVGQRASVVGQTLIKSPVSGHVGRRDAEVGMLVGPGDVLFLVGDLEDLIVEVPITEAMVSRVNPGQSVRLWGRAFADEPIDAKVSRVSPFLSAGSFSTTAEIDVHDAKNRLRPGMFVAADIHYGESEQATLIPASALWEDPQTGALSVFVIDMDNDVEAPKSDMGELGELPRRFEARTIEVLAHGRATVGVNGLKSGEWVVTIGQHLLATRNAPAARVRPTSWDRVLKLQSQQEEDLLAGFLEKQQRIAKTLGAAPPTSENFVGAREPTNAEAAGKLRQR